MNTYSKWSKPLMDISYEAGAAILDIYHNASDIEISSKDDNSPLTKADRKANAIICAHLEKISDYPIISEENKEVAFDQRKSYPYYWLVDPLDGTKEFIKRNGEFTVNIALISNNQPVFGVVYAPVLDEMYWGAKDEGAFLVKDGNTTRLQAKTFSMKDQDLGVVCSRSHLNESTQAFIDDLTAPKLVSSGSSLKFLLIASGKAHLYPRLAPTMEWDTGAAQIVLEEAGGKVVQAENMEALVYNKEDLLNPHFIAYGAVEN